MIFNELVSVMSTKEIAQNTYQTFLESSSISSVVKPGQFINILPSNNWDKMMRRPMSVASQKEGEISIIYKVVGDGTQFMKNWGKGDVVDIIGPLGNYWENFKDTFPILIGGGVGIAPILNFHSLLNQQNIKHALIMGAQTKADHFMAHEPSKQIFMTTDNGTFGIHGNVLHPLKEIINLNVSSPKVFTCGPPAMMEAIKHYTDENEILCDVALETIMACGFGICQGCTVEYSENNNLDAHSYRHKFGLVCVDGPIFNAKEIKSCHL